MIRMAMIRMAMISAIENALPRCPSGLQVRPGHATMRVDRDWFMGDFALSPWLAYRANMEAGFNDRMWAPTAGPADPGVAAFEHTDDASCRKAIGRLGHNLRDGFVGRWLQRQMAERIAGYRVEA